MGHDAASLASDDFGPGASRRDGPLPLPALAVSVVLIGLCGLLVCCLLAVLAILVLYARGGSEGVADFYSELRFNLPLKTQIGAALVSGVYAGVALATLGAATWRGRRRWPALVAWARIGGDRRSALMIVVATLAYAAIATLAMTLMQQHRVVIAGDTDMLLLGTIAANLVLLAPIGEELFFRGWLYTGLRARLPFWPSFLLTASLFAAIHWDMNHRRIFLVLPLALALGVLREITGSIKPTIALHAVYNLIIVSITLFES